MLRFIYKISGGSFLLVLILFSVSCKETIEENIESEIIEVTSPADGVKLKDLKVNFYWKAVEGADNYYVEVVTPDYANAEKMVVDTVLSTNGMTYQFSETGQYEWRVWGANNGYRTPATRRIFFIDSVDITVQQVVLTSPVNGKTVNTLNTKFKWQSIPGVSFYKLYLDNGTTVDTTAVATNELTVTLGAEQTYFWSVQAFSSIGTSSLASAVWSVKLDTTRPLDPILNLPVPGDSVFTDTVEFSWSHPLASSYDFDSVFVSSDSLGNTILFGDRGTSDMLEWVNTSPGSYYWFVKAYDNAGNESGIDEIRLIRFL